MLRVSDSTGNGSNAPERSEHRGGGAAWPGYLACVWGLIFAAISFYWGSGGTFGLNTIGGSIEAMARRGDAAIYAAVWITGTLKLVGAVLALGLVRPWGRRPPWRRTVVTGLGWTAAVLLALYGVVLVAGDALGEFGAIHVSGAVDWTALRWHLWFWDMSFVIWGLLFLAAMRNYRRALSRALVPVGEEGSS
jgi:hypothetical protein